MSRASKEYFQKYYAEHKEQVAAYRVTYKAKKLKREIKEIQKGKPTSITSSRLRQATLLLIDILDAYELRDKIMLKRRVEKAHEWHKSNRIQF